VRVARILAFLLAAITLAVSIYYWRQMPYAWPHLLPANLAACGCLLFWIKAPAKKKPRVRAALGSTAVVPCMLATAALGYVTSPIEDWKVFLPLSALALIVAIWALIRVKRKANHPWADYYREVA